MTPFREVYVQAAAGDAGGAIGAALVGRGTSWAARSAARRWTTPTGGRRFGRRRDRRALLERAQRDIDAQGCVVSSASTTKASSAAQHRGRRSPTAQVVGWFQGRMEWGPRALGNRSILGDPRRADMKDILNVKIKRRESFRPFAPSILREAVPEWFEVDDDVPFMMQVYPIRAEKRALIPAVTHVDGIGPAADGDTRDATRATTR